MRSGAVSAGNRPAIHSTHCRKLEYEHGIPRNPFINAGALVITDILASRYVQADIALLQFLRMLADEKELDFDRTVAISERQTAHRNYAIAHLIRTSAICTMRSIPCSTAIAVNARSR